jgi:hypothetical protein
MRSRLVLRVLSLAAIAAGSLVAVAPAQGRIIAIGDEWLLSEAAFTTQPQQSTQLALNIAGCFAGGQPGNFLACRTSRPSRRTASEASTAPRSRPR